MSYYFLVPTTQQSQNGQTVTAPEYLSTDLAGVNFGSIPFGAEPLALLALTAPNSALAAETDVYAFPADTTTLLQASDVTTLGAYLSNLNLPSSFLVAGMTFQSVVRQSAQIALTLQYAEGPAGTNGASVFDQLVVGNTASASLQTIPTGVFSFADVDAADSVADSIVAVSQQFTQPIYVGGGSL